MTTVTKPIRSADEQRDLFTQQLTLLLDGITADDYLAWVWDPEPPELGRDLSCLAAHPEPNGEHVDVKLVWDREPPAPRTAAGAAGLPLTPEVVQVQSS